MSNILVNIGGSQHVTLSEPHRVNRLGWKKSWRLFPNFYITLSNMRTKLRYPYRSDISQEDRRMFAALRREMYEQQGGGCPHCGKKFELREMELHHILPWSKFGWLHDDRRNLLFICHDCHKRIHGNPYLNIRLMEAKAEELNIDIKEVYKF